VVAPGVRGDVVSRQFYEMIGQAQSRFPRRAVYHAVAAALLLVLANVVEPPRVDDTAYIDHARHIAATPLSPYSGTIFWWRAPQPSVEVLAPPVALYWLAFGQNVLGESVALWKLWFLPFALLLTFSVLSLAHRFCRGLEVEALWMVVGAPTVFAGFNLMLDVPALSLMLTGVAVGARALDRRQVWLWLVAALVAGLASQTKYSAVTGGVLLGAMAVQQRRFGWAVATVGLGAAVFVGWEIFVFKVHGASMFWTALFGDSGSSIRVGFGSMTVALALMAGPALPQLLPALAGVVGMRIRAIQAVAAFVFLVYVGVALIPAANWPDGRVTGLTANLLYYATLGSLGPLFLILAGAGAWTVLSFLWRTRAQKRPDPALELLVLWVGIEILVCVFMSPFPALRRVCGIAVALTFFSLRSLTLLRAPGAGRAASQSAMAVALVAGLLFQFVDLGEGLAESAAMQRAVATAKLETARSGGTVWYAGGWAVQHHATRVGLVPIVPGQSTLAAGDVAIVARVPYERPVFSIGQAALEPIVAIDASPRSAWALLPYAYSGIRPIDRRTGPTVVLDVLRVNRSWTVR
jgi:hypothetical protein